MSFDLVRICFQQVCSYIFYPIAVIVGVPLPDALKVGSIYGKKIIMTEFLAYIELGEKAKQGLLQVSLKWGGRGQGAQP